MIVKTRSRRPHWALLVVPFLLFLYLGLGRLPTSLDLSINTNAVRAHGNATRTKGADPSVELVHFWARLLESMTRAGPQTPPVIVHNGVGDDVIDPNKNRKRIRPDRIKLPASSVDSMQRSHAEFVALTRELAPDLPYRKRSRGIVMTAGGEYVGIAVTSLLMLRRAGSKLPVQLFLDSASDYDEDVCENIMPALGAECMIMEKLWKTTPELPKLKKYQFKVFALLFSTFQEILFLDADCWPVRKPDYLFTAEPYRSHGLVTWPDFWLSTASPLFYDITKTELPSMDARRSSESGIILYNKAKHARSLLLTTYYNFHGPSHYYPLLSQGATGQGDKETFLHGALVAGAPFYPVSTRIGILGRWVNGSFESAAMKQADPAEDWALARDPRKLAVSSRLYGQEDKAPGEPHARWLFVHHNLVKVDIRHLSKSLGEKLFRRDDKGRWQRLWGDDRVLRDMAGYDVERAMWETVLKADCDGTLLVEDCGELRKWFADVFVERRGM